MPWMASGQSIRFEIGGFANRVYDFIYPNPTGTFDPESGFEIFDYTQGDATLLGFEASAEFVAAGEDESSQSPPDQVAAETAGEENPNQQSITTTEGEVPPDEQSGQESAQQGQQEQQGQQKKRRRQPPQSMSRIFHEGERISIGRRLYRSGESEYEMNGRSCRLRDIQDLFAGTGLGAAHYAIIEQGRIGQVLSAKPLDRRALIEEAAGITKFKSQKKESLRKLEYTEQNLLRVADLIREVKRQIGPLQRQARIGGPC